MCACEYRCDNKGYLMDNLQNAVSTGAMLGNLPTASLLGVIVIVLGYLLIRVYQQGIKEHGEKLDDITRASEKIAKETHDLNITTKASLEASKETREYILKNNEFANAKTQQKLDEIDKKLDKVSTSNIELKRIDGKLVWVEKTDKPQY